MGDVVKMKPVQKAVKEVVNHQLVIQHLDFVLAEQRQQYTEMRRLNVEMSKRLDCLERMEEEIGVLRDEVIRNLRKLPNELQKALSRG